MVFISIFWFAFKMWVILANELDPNLKSELVSLRLPSQHGDSLKCRLRQTYKRPSSRWNFQISFFSALTHRQLSLNGTDKGTESITGMGLTSHDLWNENPAWRALLSKTAGSLSFSSCFRSFCYTRNLADNKSLVVIAWEKTSVDKWHAGTLNHHLRPMIQVCVYFV